MVFQKTIWPLLLRVSLKKDGLVLGLQKNFRISNGITEALIGFLWSIIKPAVLTARRAAEDPWLRWLAKPRWSWTALSVTTINQELTKVSVKPHVSLACHGAAYSECWRGILYAFKRMRTSAVNANARHSRKTRSQALYRRFSMATVKRLIFIDEKDFTLEVPTNRQDDRV